jgi:hypothetical protein
MGHVSFMPHEALAAVVTTEWKIPRVSPLVTDQFVSVAKLFLAKLAGVPELEQ